MRRFGRQCRGLGKVFVTLVRQTETQLLELGQPVLALARAAEACLCGTTQLAEVQRARLDTQLRAALEAHHRIAHQSRRLTQGKALSHCKIVNAYDPTIAPICKGKSNCPTQFGRKPGIIAEPTAGFILALHLPVGNPSDASYVEPLVDKMEQAIARVGTRPTRLSALSTYCLLMCSSDRKVEEPHRYHLPTRQLVLLLLASSGSVGPSLVDRLGGEAVASRSEMLSEEDHRRRETVGRALAI